MMQSSRQSGAVLVMALLIVAVVTSMAVNMAFWFQLNLAKSENRWHGGQAQIYMQGAESLARYLLRDDLENSTIDDLGETWAQEAMPFAVEGGWLTATMVDAQGRLNLNSLGGAITYTNGGYTVDFERLSESQKQFVRLLQTFDEPQLSADEAYQLLEAVVDWTDGDDNVSGSGGAELYHYQQQEPSYNAANQRFFSVTELRLVRHVTPEIYSQLLPLVSVLPDASSININTAPSAVLRGLGNPTDNSPLSLDDAQSLVEARRAQLDSKGEGFEKVEDLFDTAEAAAIFADPDQLPTAGLSVTSEYFEVVAEASIAKQRRRGVSLLRRDAATIATVGRSAF